VGQTSICRGLPRSKTETRQGEHPAEKVPYPFVILSEAGNLSLVYAQKKKERFFAPLRMTK
jgi:hypothetical protein